MKETFWFKKLLKGWFDEIFFGGIFFIKICQTLWVECLSKFGKYFVKTVYIYSISRNIWENVLRVSWITHNGHDAYWGNFVNIKVLLKKSVNRWFNEKKFFKSRFFPF